MIQYVNSETGELLGSYPPSRDKNISLVVTPEAYKILEWFYEMNKIAKRKGHKMIINIPLTIDDELWASALARDYESKVTEKLTAEVRKAICDHDVYKDQRRGMASWVGDRIDDILKEYKDEIIDSAADKLAERLARTKKAKEIIK